MLVLIRHAKPQSSADFTISISEEGRLIQKNMCKNLKKENIIPTKIFHSPLLRAEQTAHVMSDFFNVNAQKLDALGDDFQEEVIIDTLNHLPQNETVFLVGHGPSLYTFANMLANTPCLSQELPRSGACVLQFAGKVATRKATFVRTYTP